MFWFIYLFASLYFSHLFARKRKDNYLKIFSFFLVFLLTPAQISVSSPEYAPSLFIFLFNILFEEEFSTRVLRPLLISLPLTLVFLKFYSFIKNRFF